MTHYGRARIAKRGEAREERGERRGERGEGREGRDMKGERRGKSDMTGVRYPIVAGCNEGYTHWFVGRGTDTATHCNSDMTGVRQR